MDEAGGALPGTVLLDLDDTILDDSSTIDHCWRRACETHHYSAHTTDAVHAAIRKTSEWFWADAERHRAGRLDLDAARTEVVRLALAELGIEDRSLAATIARSYAAHREAGMEPLPDAIETVRWLRAKGCKLALITNGAADAQRRKLVRFELAGLFDEVLVEGELGFGKPDERIYRLALRALDARPEQAWMIGDNLEWDVVAPQRLGVFGIWIDRKGAGVPSGSGAVPDRIVRSLCDVRLRPMK